MLLLLRSFSRNIFIHQKNSSFDFFRHSSYRNYPKIMEKNINDQKNPESIPKIAIFKEVNDGMKFNFSIFVSINDPINLNRQFNLSRSLDESAFDFLFRLETNIDRIISKKKKAKSKKRKSQNEYDNDDDNKPQISDQQQSESKIAKFLLNGESIAEASIREIKMNEILKNPQIQLQILSETYELDFNPPSIDNLKLPLNIMTGFLVYPQKFQMDFGTRDESNFYWYVDNANYDDKTVKIPDWHLKGESFYYTPDNQDVGKNLKLVAVPKNGDRQGLKREQISSTTIQAGVGQCAGFHNRHQFTKILPGKDEVRVVTYNLLADLYADSDYSRDVLHPQCPKYALEFEYRKSLILKELLGYNSDIICLQEVDRKFFKWDLFPVLSSLGGYDGVYESKGGELAEGLSCFWRKDKFRKLDSEVMIMNETLRENHPDFKDLNNAIRANSNLEESIMKRKTAFLSTILEPIDDPDKILIVGITHLFFQPDADHIRLIQTEMCLIKLRQISKYWRETKGKKEVALLFCGDFNSVPSNGVYEYIRNGVIKSDHSDWQSCKDQEVNDLEIRHNFSMDSACGTPKYTNFTLLFADCLDYIFYDKNAFSVSQVIPFPSEEELTLNRAIPNQFFPSDHIPCIADLKWNK